MHNVYLTYEEYKGYGGDLPQSSFVILEFQCRKKIDYMTDSRVQRMSNVPEAVKLCMMSLIPIENKTGATAQATNPVVTSFSTDGYSESYGKAMSAADSEQTMRSTINTLLYGVLDDNGIPLLYRGLC